MGLGAAEKATLDLSGDGFLQVAVPSTSGVKEALIQNNGSVSANGGAVIMMAATARNAVRNAINLSGVVEANSVGGQNGAITIGGGEGGNVAVSGTITTTAAQGNSGKVNITGDSIVLTGARVDVSGKTGGGTVNIGECDRLDRLKRYTERCYYRRQQYWLVCQYYVNAGSCGQHCP